MVDFGSQNDAAIRSLAVVELLQRLEDSRRVVLLAQRVEKTCWGDVIAPISVPNFSVMNVGKLIKHHIEDFSQLRVLDQRNEGVHDYRLLKGNHLLEEESADVVE